MVILMIQSIFTGDYLSEIIPENILDEAILLFFSVIKGKFVVKTRLGLVLCSIFSDAPTAVGLR